MAMKGEAAQSINIFTIFDELRPVNQLTKDELREECERWREIIDYIPEDVRGLLAQINQKVIIVKRDGETVQGSYLQPQLNIVGHVFRTLERRYNSIDKKFFIYENESTVPTSNIVDFKFVKGTFEDTVDEKT